MKPEELKNKIVLVLGAGKTGIAASSFLLSKTKELMLSDANSLYDSYKTEIANLEKEGVKTEFGKNSSEFLNKADLVVISPGISPHTEIVKTLMSKGVPVLSDIELGSYFSDKPIIAVTGTNGKTTTTSLMTHIINSSGKKAVSCGNIGNPFIKVIQDKDKNNADYYVIEISSYQIYYSTNLKVDIAVGLNITPDHLDWHGSLEHYVESKKKLFLQQDKNSWSVLNLNDPILKNLKLPTKNFNFSIIKPKNANEISYISYLDNNELIVKMGNKTEIMLPRNKIKIPGLHNVENVLACLAVSKIINLDNEKIVEGVATFSGVEHRIELVKRIDGKEFYNDSKATNPEATIKAIEAFNGRKLLLILGGRDKNTDLSEMITSIKKNVSEVMLFGEAKDRFVEELKKNNFSNVKILNSLDEVIKESVLATVDVVLFSPACASFDMFTNYEDRGKKFKELVLRY